MEPNTLDYTLGRIAGRLDSIDEKLETLTNDNRSYNERLIVVENHVGRLNWLIGGMAATVAFVVSFASDWVRAKLGI